MQTNKKYPFHKSSVIKAILIFIISYVVTSVLWKQIDDSYTHFVTIVSLKVVTAMKDTELTEITRQDSVTRIKFTPLKRKDMILEAKINKSFYTFGAPVTISILAALFPFIQRRLRACIDCLILLFSTHFIYIFFLAMRVLTILLMDRGIEATGELHLAVYNFLWDFSGRMLLRLGPFLIGVYIFLRYKIPRMNHRTA
jgi:hypothetical protein